METVNKNVRVNANNKKILKNFCSDNTIYDKLKEAELEINNTSKRYSKELGNFYNIYL